MHILQPQHPACASSRLHKACKQSWRMLQLDGQSTGRGALHGTCMCVMLCVAAVCVNLQVESVNLAGLDRVLVAYAAGSSDRSLLLRQYRIGFKKSGTKVCMAH